MSAHQEAYLLISKMPEESVRLLLELIHNMTPAFRLGVQAESEVKNSDTSCRLGAGKGIITDPVDFDRWDDEIAALFEGDAL